MSTPHHPAYDIAVPDFDLIVFGASGDLARRKIFPALWDLHQDGWLPETGRIIAAARKFPNNFPATLRRDCGAEESAGWKKFTDSVIFADNTDAAGDLRPLAKMLGPAESRARVFYAALPPALYAPLAESLSAADLSPSPARIVLEKPIGRDLESYRAINAAVARRFSEGQIFRIDHYLGKETVQNLLVTRFANLVWEPLWNRAHIDHVQISAAESAGAEGRAGYYESSGALRDMAQNHLLQLLCLAAMEPPRSLDPDAVRDEKVKVLHSLRPLSRDDFVVGQYAAGAVDGQPASAYRTDANAPDSKTETFAALRAHIDNWRWAGVPFYLRTGKRMATRATVALVQFRRPPVDYFGGESAPNRIIIRLQPNEGVELQTLSKRPGPGGISLRPTTLNLNYAESLGKLPDAYERLLLDALRGIRTLYMRNDEIEAAWKWLAPALDSGREPEMYSAGSWGPDAAQILLAKEGRQWHNPM